MFSGKLVFFPFQRNIRFENLFTIHDGGYDVSLGDLLDVIVQEVAVEHCSNVTGSFGIISITGFSQMYPSGSPWASTCTIS